MIEYTISLQQQWIPCTLSDIHSTVYVYIYRHMYIYFYAHGCSISTYLSSQTSRNDFRKQAAVLRIKCKAKFFRFTIEEGWLGSNFYHFLKFLRTCKGTYIMEIVCMICIDIEIDRSRSWYCTPLRRSAYIDKYRYIDIYTKISISSPSLSLCPFHIKGMYYLYILCRKETFLSHCTSLPERYGAPWRAGRFTPPSYVSNLSCSGSMSTRNRCSK